MRILEDGRFAVRVMGSQAMDANALILQCRRVRAEYPSQSIIGIHGCQSGNHGSPMRVMASARCCTNARPAGGRLRRASVWISI